MGMVVRTNTMALNAYRQLGMNNSAVSKSLEKLASGYRINRAGDDAAGLAISEKMKAQITGLETASANAQDGISLIQTAEGNLGEVHDMLNRMVELATKSANGTYTSIERDALQSEVDQLLEEIDRISQSANFNGARLLDGSLRKISAIEQNNIVSSSAQAAKELTGVDAELGVTKTADNHANPDGLAKAQAPQFSINLADYELKLDDSAADAKTVTASLAVDGKTISFYDAPADYNVGTTASATAVALELQTNAAAGTTDVSKKGSDIAALVDDKVAIIGNDLYLAEVTGSEITFTYKGTVDEDGEITAKDTAGDSVSNATWTPKGDVTISTTDDDGVIKEENGRDNCHITKITDPVAGGDAVRSGATLELTQEIIDRGSLTIGDTTFTFDKTVEAGGTGTPTNATPGNKTGTVTIGIKGLKDDALLKAVTEQMSHCTAKITKDGKEYDFNVGRGAEENTIEIEEMGQGADITKLGAFTEEELQKAFKQTAAATKAKVEITLSKDADNNFVNASVGNTLKIGDATYTFTDKDPAGTGEIKVGKDAAETLENIKTALGADKYTVTVDKANGKITIENKQATPADPAAVEYTANALDAGGLTLQIGDTADDFNKMTVAVADMSAKGLGLDGLQITKENLASDAIDTIKKAINSVSSARAGMGALQNRLEHTINNLDVAAENLSAANSRIRDTDMAKEMMNYTKMNVLVQSAQAMLAQANQQPQSVLQLLQ